MKFDPLYTATFLFVTATILGVGCHNDGSNQTSQAFQAGQVVTLKQAENEKFVISKDWKDGTYRLVNVATGAEITEVLFDELRSFEKKEVSGTTQKVHEIDGKRFLLVEIPEWATVVDDKVFDLRDRELTVEELLILIQENK